MLLQADARQLVFLKALLHNFAESTGLKVNYSKSHMYPINVSNERMAHLASTFGCDIGTMSFTYLGLPMGTERIKMPKRGVNWANSKFLRNNQVLWLAQLTPCA